MNVSVPQQSTRAASAQPSILLESSREDVTEEKKVMAFYSQAVQIVNTKILRELVEETRHSES